MGFSHLHVIHKPTKRAPIAAQPVEVEVVEKRADAACTTGFYTAPKMGASVDSLQPLPISWNTACLSAKEIDIYLYSPGSQYPRIHVWEGVALSRGSYTADIMPRWWNATASQSLQISIVPAGEPPFLSTFPGGPVFTATYTQPASGIPIAADVTQIDSGITQVNDGVNAKKSASSGKKAVAVLLPLLFIGLCVAAFLRMKRSRNIEKRKRWTETVDKRMSTISTDWKSVSGAGANAAIRNSMAVGVRNSSFSFGALRPSSIAAVEGEETTIPHHSQMSQMRTGVGLRHPNPVATNSSERISRVSFAPDTRMSRASVADSRPSGESSRKTRAFHSAYVPPVPALPDQIEQEAQDNNQDDRDNAASFSPKQAQGALNLTSEDIRSRIVAGQARNAERENSSNAKESNFADMMPALSMMRTGGTGATANDEYLLPTAPSSPVSSYAPALKSSSMAGMPTPAIMPMQPMPASVMSPDEMLRAYAERKKTMSPVTYPMPAATSASPTPSTNTMRVLYNADTGNVNSTYAETTTASGYSEYVSDYQDAYGGHEGAGESVVGGHPYAFGHHTNESIGVSPYGGAQYAIGDDEDDHAHAYGHAA